MNDLTADLTLAARRAEAKRAVASVLAQYKLPAADRKAVLLDLAMESDVNAGMAEKPPVEQVGKVANGWTRSAKRGRPVKRRKATGVADDAGRTDTLLATLKASPGMPIKDLAAKVYGDIDQAAARGRTRSLLTSLKGQERVKNTGPGRWETV